MTEHRQAGQLDGPSERIDEANWQILRDAVIAAHAGDAAATALAIRRFDTDVPLDGRAGTYLWWLLRHRLAQLVGHRPSRGDLTQIAGYAEEKFGTVVRDVSLLEKVLLSVWKLAPDRQVTPGEFMVAGVTALGLLLNDPESYLDGSHPALMEWWAANLEKFSAQGILKDNSRTTGRINR